MPRVDRSYPLGVVLPPDQAVRLLRGQPGLIQLDRLDWTAAAVLKATDSGSVVELAVERAESRKESSAFEHGVIAKSMSLASQRDRAKAAARHHRLWRQWRGSEQLAGIVPTAPLIALYQGERDDLPVLTLLMGRVPGPTLLDQLAKDQADDLAGPVGELLGRLIRHRLYNRDPKPSNLIVAAQGLTTIDTVAIRRTIRPVRSLTRMLAALVLEPTGVGSSPSRAWLTRAVASAVDRAGLGCDPAAILARVDAVVAGHGDPTPRDNPLSTTRPGLRE